MAEMFPKSSIMEQNYNWLKWVSKQCMPIESELKVVLINISNLYRKGQP